MTNPTVAEAPGTVRPATMQDVDEIHDLVNFYAERNKMLFQVLEELYERIREFRVFADPEGKVRGCCALSVMWRDLGEIRSLAVDPNCLHRGIGRRLVLDAIEEARRLGLRQVFALTYEAAFFEKLGFALIAREKLPHKVWTDCIRCEMQNDCREIPLILEL